MKQTTTHHLGRQPGRARLHTCAPNAAGNQAGSWRRDDAAQGSMHTTGVYAVTPTFELTGLGSIKRPAQHLVTRTT